MPYAVLEKKLQAMPERYFDQISSFFDLLLSLDKHEDYADEKARKLTPGLAKGIFKYPDDINAGDEIIADAFGEYL